MDCSTPGLPVLHCLPEFAQIHAHRVGDASNHLSLCCHVAVGRQLSGNSLIRMLAPANSLPGDREAPLYGVRSHELVRHCPHP